MMSPRRVLTGALALVSLTSVAGALLVAPAIAPAARASKKQPDLTVTAVAVRGAANPGKVITATATVRNAGTANARASRTVFAISADTKLGKGDVRIAPRPTRALKARASTKVVGRLTIPSSRRGKFYVLVCADAQRKVRERSEKNNCRVSKRLTIVVPATTTTPTPTQPAPTGSVHTVSLVASRDAVEGNTGTANLLAYDIALDSVAGADVTVSWATHATAGSSSSNDFVASSGSATIPAGQTTVTVTVPIVGDTRSEGDETVQVYLTAASGANLGRSTEIRRYATILDDDQMVASATSTSQTTVMLHFNDGPTNTAGDGSQFTIPGLVVINAAQSGNDITLTTTAQVANRSYTVKYASTLVGGHRPAPTDDVFTGTGPVAQLQLTEVNANVTGSDDLVELRALTGGSISGARIGTTFYGYSGSMLDLPDINVAANDIILVHGGAPTGVVTETSGTSECTDSACVNGAWDVRETSSLSLTSALLGVEDADGDLMDAVAFRVAAATSDASLAIDMLMEAQLDGLWLPADCGGSDCDTGAEYDSVSIDWSGTSTSATGASMRRTWGVDNDQAGDWSLGTSSWGLVNP
ncbi:MAG: hypothetical protein KDC46_05030 [Thermoleophilia bacterium]|nr:hypothetical protein [Thermoleophilia bacterium]